MSKYMHEQDRLNGQVAVVELTVICVIHYFVSSEIVAHSKGAMFVSLFFTVDTLPNAGNAFTVCMFSRVSIFYTP